MKFSRPTLAVALSSVLVLSACSGGDAVEDEATGAATSETAASPGPLDGSASTTAPADGSAGTGAAGEDAAATTAPGDDAAATTVAMSTDEATAAITLAEAEEQATKVLTARAEADQGDGEDILQLQRNSMMGNAREAQSSADRLESVTGAPEEIDLEENPVQPNVLAISRDDGELPLIMLVQTVPAEGAPVLHLLESRSGETKDFRISWEAPMLPGTEVPAFDRRSVGTPVIREGQGDLTMPPGDLLKSVAADINFPVPEETQDYETHGYADAVRDAAQAQADEVAGRATLEEKNWIYSDDTKALLFEDGSALVTGVLLRNTTFTVESGNVLTPPDTYRVFHDDGSLEDEAVLRTMVFVAMHAPSEQDDFTPEMIAAREQLVDAWGS